MPPKRASMGGASQKPLVSPAMARVLDAAAEILDTPNPSPADIAFMARWLVQTTLPHTDPGNVPTWTRRNGDLVLVLQAGRSFRSADAVSYPYGTVPRLLLFWMTTEALRTQSRTLHPGDSVAAFMKAVGLNPDNGSTGAARSDARRLRDQMYRLFRCRVSFERETGGAKYGTAQWLDMPITSAASLWWDFREPRQGALFGSSLELGEKFYEAIMESSVPLDMRALRALRRSPLMLDLYAWAVWRTFAVTKAGKAAFVPWKGLADQLGSAYADPKSFKRAAKAALRRVQAVYPPLRLDDAVGGLIIKPAPPAVLPRSG